MGPAVGQRGCLSPHGHPRTSRLGRAGWRQRPCARGAAAGRSRFLAARQRACSAAAPGSVSGAPWPGLPLLRGHLLTPGSPWHCPTAAATGSSVGHPKTPGGPPPALPQGSGSYLVGGGWQWLDTEQQAVGQAEVAVPVEAEVLAPPHQLVDLQARQPGHGRRGGDDGGHDPPGDPLALKTEGVSPAAPRGTGTCDPVGCPPHRQPVGRGDAIVLCAQVGRCHDEVHVDVVVLQGRAQGHQPLVGTSASCGD